MSKTTHRGASRAKETEHSSSAKLLLLSGFFVGVVSTLGFQWFLQQDRADTGGPASAAEAPAAREFEFYTLLGNLEVQVPDAQLTSAEEDNIIYWLQAASFRDAADAENLRVSLLLKNLEAEVKPVSQNGILWHRVIVGPFATKTLVASAKQSLLEDGMQPMTLRQELSE